MVSSFYSKRKRPNDISLYNIPNTSKTSEHFNYIAMRGGSEVALQTRQSPVLEPSLGTPVATCYRGPNQAHTHGNRITKEFEFHVA